MHSTTKSHNHLNVPKIFKEKSAHQNTMDTSNNPNGFSDEELKGNQDIADLPRKQDGAIDIDALSTEQAARYWRHQAAASTKGFHAYKQRTDNELELERKRREELEASQKNMAPQPDSKTYDFSEMGVDENSQQVLNKVVEIAEERAYNRFKNDPNFVASIQSNNKARFDEAFTKLSQEEGYEPISNYKSEIIANYFGDLSDIPEDIYGVLKTVAGSVLYHHRDEIDASNKPKHDRVDMLGGNSGDKSVAPTRSMEYWTRLANEDPQEFAKPENQKLFNDDMRKL